MFGVPFFVIIFIALAVSFIRYHFVVIYALLIHLEYQYLIGESVHLHKDLAKTSSFPNIKIMSFRWNKELISSTVKQIIYL